MKRRTVLGAAGGLAATALSGCLEGFQEHFTGEVSTPIPIEIVNEGSIPYNITLEAYERETDRQTYDESYTITPGERVGPPNLEGTEQRFRVIRFDEDGGNEDLVKTGAITPDTHLVRIVVDDDSLLLDISEDPNSEPGETPENETDASENESDENGTGSDEDGTN